MVTGNSIGAKQIIDIQGAVNWIESYVPARRQVFDNDGFVDEGKAVSIAMTHTPSVSGSGGHVEAFKCARRLFRCGMTEQQIYILLRDYFNPRCSPEWSERELKHKARQATREQ